MGSKPLRAPPRERAPPPLRPEVSNPERAGRERGPAGAQVLALLNSPKTYRPEAA